MDGASILANYKYFWHSFQAQYTGEAFKFLKAGIYLIDQVPLIKGCHSARGYSLAAKIPPQSEPSRANWLKLLEYVGIL